MENPDMNKMPKKQIFSAQIDLSKFEKATDEEKRQAYMQLIVRLLMSAAMLGNERALQELAELDKHIGTNFAEQARQVVEENRRKAAVEAGLDPNEAEGAPAPQAADAAAAPAAEGGAFPGTAPNKD